MILNDDKNSLCNVLLRKDFFFWNLLLLQMTDKSFYRQITFSSMRSLCKHCRWCVYIDIDVYIRSVFHFIERHIYFGFPSNDKEAFFLLKLYVKGYLWNVMKRNLILATVGNVHYTTIGVYLYASHRYTIYV